jgi:hypothetical protein
MPHFKCVPCKTRMSSAAGTDGLVGDLCPYCGSPLEPVGDLAEIVGFQSIKAREGGAEDRPPGAYQRLADRVDDVVARHAASCTQARLDAARWIDDGGSVSTDPAAESVGSVYSAEEPW